MTTGASLTLVTVMATFCLSSIASMSSSPFWSLPSVTSTVARYVRLPSKSSSTPDATRSCPVLPSMVNEAASVPGQRVDEGVVDRRVPGVQVGGGDGSSDSRAVWGILLHFALAVLGGREHGRRVHRRRVAHAGRYGVGGLVQAMTVPVRRDRANVVATILLQCWRVRGGRGACDVDPVRPAVGRARPLPADAGWAVIVFQRRRHLDAGLNCPGVRGERHRPPALLRSRG